MPATDCETLILRFRDLVGPTIASHREEIDEHGYTWWAWWHKPGEVFPHDLFASLQAKARSDAISVFLLHSGSQSLYRARITDMAMSRTTAVQSPEPAATPLYYREQKWHAWFKITEISAVPSDEVGSTLQGYSYVRVDDFLTDGESKYLDFHNKVVSSSEELVQQNRTIWFVRRAKGEDLRHEIKLLDAGRVTPYDFPEEPVIRKGSTIIWLSDLHFSSPAVRDGPHAFPTEEGVAGKPVWNRVSGAVKADAPAGDRTAAVLISGDLTWRAASDEYDDATTLISNLGSDLGLRDYDFAICPGNHDLAYSDDPSDASAAVRTASDGASGGFRGIYQKLFHKAPNQYLCSGRWFILGQHIPVEIVALNSSLLQQAKDHFQGHGFVGEDQLAFVAKQMRWNGVPTNGRTVRMVMLHHHLLPVTFRDVPARDARYSVALDAEAIIRWCLHHGVRFVLHGHMHHPHYCKLVRPESMSAAVRDDRELYVLGIGSAGVAQQYLGEIGRNTIGILRFSADNLVFSVHSIHPINDHRHEWSIELPLHKS